MTKRKKRATITTTGAISRLDRMIPILYRNVVNAIRIEATMEAGNEVVGLMPDKTFAGADAYNVIKQSLGYDLAMHLARLYDVGNRNRPANKRDVASIPLAVRLLRQKRCHAALKARARNWLPHGTYANVFEVDCAKALSRASKGYSDTFKGPFGRSGLKTLKASRDNFMAHSLMTDIDARLIYNQLFRLTDCARDFVEAARLAVSGDNSSLGEQEELFKNEARRFWRMALLADRGDDETLPEWASAHA
ncbi:hypothetical protein DBIPINDM_006906 [Mesorhizobium sp. AR02]|uniref:AbiU2 domain-containing protein n=1 Tax=Mesorhizobium sp. AR02 TaxID=2865837 RepID=UPI002160A4ED|nr:hypothetical protein [Mesorhizobium sp. AR02]UVK53414.1 hypothetical protein DBIPINDM_006906 [Mesorhizobium sp. AR02]